jgi:ribosomal protein S21|tara:strand:- start:510 stop:731 length:222 start_codon:yes stop_codon:yes gene_type:complete
VAVNISVRLRRGETSDRLVRRFIKKCKKEKILETYRAKTDHHIKPSVKRKMKRKKAIRERQKLQRKQERKLFR